MNNKWHRGKNGGKSFAENKNKEQADRGKKLFSLYDVNFTNYTGTNAEKWM